LELGGSLTLDRRRIRRRGASLVLALAASVVMLLAFAAPRAAAFGYLTTWGSTGPGDGQFSAPGGVAVDSTGNVYVADSENHRIQKFSAHGVFLAKWGTQGGGDREFTRPGDVATDVVGNVYVADTDNHRVQKFTSSGGDLRKWGSFGGGEGELNLPSGIATDPAANVYVADTENHRIQKFTARGDFMTQWGSSGTGDGQFDHPADVTTDEAGNVYVADTGNQRIQKFDAGGGFLGKWEGLSSPSAVEADRAGNVYVAEASRFLRFGTDGVFAASYDVWADNQAFEVLRGLGADCRGNLYVTDAGDRIHKFGEPGAPDPPCRPAPPSPPPPAPVSDSTAPGITSASLSNRTFRVNRRGAVAARKRSPRGTVFRLSLTEAASVGFAIKRRVPGRRVKGKCRSAGKTRKGRKCTLLRTAGSFSRALPAGRGRVAFSGRLLVRGKARALRPGRYRATLRATDPAGNRSKPRRLHFRVARR
jgi:hypothetical protein